MDHIRTTLRPVAATALVLGLGIAVAVAGGDGGAPASPSVPTVDAVASDASMRAAGRPVAASAPATPEGGDAISVLPAPIGSCTAGGPLEVDGIPPGATVYRWVNGTYVEPAHGAEVRAAVAGVARVPAGKVECYDGTPEPAVAEDAARSGGQATASAPASGPTGSGTCHVQWTPAVRLPKGATITASVNGEYRERGHEDRVRAAVAQASGRPAAEIECNYWVPPIGSCQAELRPAPGSPVPDGATAYGNVGGEYTTRAQVAGLRAALASMAGLDPEDITCTDFPGPGVGVPEPLPIEPGAGGSGKDTPAASTP